MNKIKNVALYMRYSSDKQTEQSIEGQERVCREYCKQHKYNIIQCYYDRALSGFKSVEKRTSFLQMIKDSKDYDAIVVYKLDRFSRNEYDSAVYEYKLKQNNCVLLSATESISDNAEGVLMKSIIKGFAEYYSKELSQKVKRGMNESQRKHLFIGSYVPLGYKIIDRQYYIDEITAPIVVEIFDRYNKGYKITEIAKYLNEKGIKTSKGNEFNKQSFHRLLTNKKYIGIYEYKIIENGNEVIKSDENAIPPIIDKEVFFQVQDKITGNKGRKAVNTEYLLSGKLYYDGVKMVSESCYNAKGKPYYYYRCRDKRIKKEQLEREVITAIKSVLTEEFIHELAHNCYLENENRINNDYKIKELENCIKEAKREIETITNISLQLGGMDENFKNRYLSATNRLNFLESELAEHTIDKKHYSEEDFVNFLTQYLTGRIEDTTYDKDIIRSLLYKIDIEENNTMEITLNATENKKTNAENSVRKCIKWWTSSDIKRTFNSTLFKSIKFFIIF